MHLGLYTKIYPFKLETFFILSHLSHLQSWPQCSARIQNWPMKIINLYLNVIKNYRSDGYHEIKSIIQSISLSDELTFKVIKSKNNYSSENKNGIYITCNNEDTLLDEKNLVRNAAATLVALDNLFNLDIKFLIWRTWQVK